MRLIARIDRLTGVLLAVVAGIAVFGIAIWLGNLGAPPGSWRAAVAARLRTDPLVPYVVLLPLLFLVDVRPLRPWLWRTLAVVSVVAFWPVVYGWVHEMDWGQTTAVVAISRAAFEGISLPALQAAVAVAFAGAGLMGLTAAAHRPPVLSADDPPARVAPGFLALGFLWALVLTAPDLPGALAWLESVEYSPHWDGNNLMTWGYWTANGYLPFRDFWYPYGGLFLYDMPWPAGPSLFWATSVARYAVFAFALMLSSPRRWSVLVAAAALLAAETSGLNFSVHRYMLAANVVLAFVAARRWDFSGIIPRLTLGTALVMALVLEPAQLVYAVPAVAAIVLVDMIRARRLGQLWRGPAFCALVLLGASAMLAIGFWRFGMLSEMLAFYGRLGDTAQYAAFPATVVPSPWPDFPMNAVLVIFPAAILIAGLVEARRADAQARVRAAALIGLAVFDFMVLQKHLIRFMPDTLALNVLVTGLAYGVLAPVGRWGPDRLGLGAGVGLLIGVLALQGRLDERIAVARQLPGRMMRTLSALPNAEIHQRANRARFAPERFVQFHEQRRLVDELTTRLGRVPRLFSLSDDPLLFLFTRQAPAWHTNLYNGSPIYEQARIIDDLRANPPDFVVADPSRLVFDGIQLGVRVPDIVGFVVSTYVPEAPVPPFAVLRPRRPDEAVPLDFWTGLLGTTIDLGMVPARLGRESRDSCEGPASCDQTLVLEATTPTTGSAIVVLDLGGTPVHLRVRLTRHQSRYVIPVSRLWPAVATRESGAAIVATPPAGFTLEWSSASRPAGWLY